MLLHCGDDAWSDPRAISNQNDLSTNTHTTPHHTPYCTPPHHIKRDQTNQTEPNQPQPNQVRHNLEGEREGRKTRTRKWDFHKQSKAGGGNLPRPGDRPQAWETRRNGPCQPIKCKSSQIWIRHSRFRVFNNKPRCFSLVHAKPPVTGMLQKNKANPIAEYWTWGDFCELVILFPGEHSIQDQIWLAKIA